jgi:DNA-binding FrmR family transcriptional regulator
MPSHQDQLVRLNRVSGQIDGIKKMIEQGRYCLDIMNQISATRAALKAIELNILQKHLNTCVMQALSDEEKSLKISEIERLFEREMR